MYKVTSTTHFADWYVGEMDMGCFETIEEAMELFGKLREEGFESDYSSLDDYIAGCYHKDDPAFDEFNKGFIIFIYNDDDVVVYQGFEYDHKSHSTEERSEIIFNLELLTQEEISVLLDLGYNLCNE